MERTGPDLRVDTRTESDVGQVDGPPREEASGG